jgi:hypothetical protein
MAKAGMRLENEGKQREMEKNPSAMGGKKKQKKKKNGKTSKRRQKRQRKEPPGNGGEDPEGEAGESAFQAGEGEKTHTQHS